MDMQSEPDVDVKGVSCGRLVGLVGLRSVMFLRPAHLLSPLGTYWVYVKVIF